MCVPRFPACPHHLRAGATGIALALAWGCAHHRPTYVPLDAPLPEVDGGDEAVRASVRWAMERGRVPRITWSPVAGVPPREVGAEDLDRLPPEAVWLTWVCSPRRMRGAELDLLVHTSGGPVPMTVQVGVDGAVHLYRGDAPPEPATARADREAWMREIARRNGLGGVVDGARAWSRDELDALSRALGLLDPRERLLLRGLVVSRDARSPRSPRELALYDPLVEPVAIHVYDAAFEAGRFSFVGPVDAPRPAPVMTLLHEFGHVLSDAPVAAASARWAAAVEALRAAPAEDRPAARAALREARRDVRQTGRRGPVIRDYARLRAGRAWPTAWSTDVFESFAEAFALYRTDPDALQRVAPDVWRWFAEDGHLAWRAFPE